MGMGIIKRGYSLQFARRPPRFSGVVSTSVQGENARVLRSEVMTLLEKGAIEMGFSSFERVRLLQPLLPRPQKGWRPPAHPRSQTPESRPHETAVQDDHAEADPFADLHRGLVLFSGPERRILSHPDSPPSQTILEIRLRGSGLPVHGAYPWAVLAPLTLRKCMDAALSPLRQDGNPHSQLPRRLAHSGPVQRWELLSHRPLILSHLERWGSGSISQSALSPSQRISFLGTVLDSVT